MTWISQYQVELIGFGILEGNIPSITATLGGYGNTLERTQGPG